jgi:hypothetical protein
VKLDGRERKRKPATLSLSHTHTPGADAEQRLERRGAARTCVCLCVPYGEPFSFLLSLHLSSSSNQWAVEGYRSRIDPWLAWTDDFNRQKRGEVLIALLFFSVYFRTRHTHKLVALVGPLDRWARSGETDGGTATVQRREEAVG